MSEQVPGTAVKAARLALVLFVGNPDWLEAAAEAVAGAVAPLVRTAERERIRAGLDPAAQWAFGELLDGADLPSWRTAPGGDREDT